jgi:hypothetical protein
MYLLITQHTLLFLLVQHGWPVERAIGWLHPVVANTSRHHITAKSLPDGLTQVTCQAYWVDLRSDLLNNQGHGLSDLLKEGLTCHVILCLTPAVRAALRL